MRTSPYTAIRLYSYLVIALVISKESGSALIPGHKSRSGTLTGGRQIACQISRGYVLEDRFGGITQAKHPIAVLAISPDLQPEKLFSPIANDSPIAVINEMGPDRQRNDAAPPV